MQRRRRPLLPEEIDRRALRQVTTGRGQANARPVQVSASRLRTVRPAGLAFIYGNPADRLNLTLDNGTVTAGSFSPVTSSGGLQFNGGLVYAEDDGFGGWVMTRAGLYLCATTMKLTGTAGDVVLMNDSYSQVMTGSLITVGHQAGLTLPFIVGDVLPIPYIRNVSAHSVTIADCQLNMYPIL